MLFQKCQKTRFIVYLEKNTKVSSVLRKKAMRILWLQRINALQLIFFLSSNFFNYTPTKKVLLASSVIPDIATRTSVVYLPDLPPSVTVNEGGERFYLPCSWQSLTMRRSPRFHCPNRHFELKFSIFDKSNPWTKMVSTSFQFQVVQDCKKKLYEKYKK